MVGCAPCMETEAGLKEVELLERKIVTKFIAETLLPTRHGKFRVRGYKHSVGGVAWLGASAARQQEQAETDDGTFFAFFLPD